jgi:hypothetical protein
MRRRSKNTSLRDSFRHPTRTSWMSSAVAATRPVQSLAMPKPWWLVTTARTFCVSQPVESASSLSAVLSRSRVPERLLMIYYLNAASEFLYDMRRWMIDRAYYMLCYLICRFACAPLMSIYLCSLNTDFHKQSFFASNNQLVLSVVMTIDVVKFCAEV